MKNEAEWKPSKFELVGGELKASRNTEFVSSSSVLNTELLAAGLQKLLQTHVFGRLLDLGCGRVPLYEVYHTKTKSITRVDWENRSTGITHLDLTSDLNSPLPLDAGMFDTVILTDVLEHIAEPDQLIGEMRRVLERDGVLIGSVPFLYRLHEEPHDYYRYTEYALRRFALKHGFVVVHLSSYGEGTDVLFDLLGKLAVQASWRFGDRLSTFFQSFGLRFRDSSWAKRINQRSRWAPLGYVFVFRAS